jgi:thioredoxin reductase (NADPH)
MRNVVIIGSGCAGNTAAIYTARANLKPLVISGVEPGGQLSLTTEVENFPGFPEGILGPVLVENMRKQAERFGAEYQHGAVIEADLSRRPFRLSVEGEWIETRTLIVASGASARWIGLDSEKKLIGKGVSSCATCDGAFYRGKKIMVVGGGDSAMGRGQLPHPLRQRSRPGAPPRPVPRLKNHARTRPRQSQDQVGHQHRRGRNP